MMHVALWKTVPLKAKIVAGGLLLSQKSATWVKRAVVRFMLLM